MLCILFYVLVLYVEHTFGELNVTLWQFGTDRLLHHGGVTQPLRPIGVASDELSTTYIFEVLYPTTTHDSLGTTLSTVRTIIASASGWVEVFDSGNVNLECKFVDSDTGGLCSDENFTKTGHASPVVLTVQPSLTSSATAGVSPIGSPSTTAAPTPTSSDYQSSSAPSPTAVPSEAIQSSQVGAIVGSTLAGVVFVFIALTILILWLRRRRKNQGLDKRDKSLENYSSMSSDIVAVYTPSLRVARDFPEPSPSHGIKNYPGQTVLYSIGEHSLTQTETSHYHFENGKQLHKRTEETLPSPPSPGESSRAEESTFVQSEMTEILDRLRRLEDQQRIQRDSHL